jgi:hypothetical protein
MLESTGCRDGSSGELFEGEEPCRISPLPQERGEGVAGGYSAACALISPDT